MIPELKIIEINRNFDLINRAVTDLQKKVEELEKKINETTVLVRAQQHTINLMLKDTSIYTNEIDKALKSLENKIIYKLENND